MIKVTGDRMSGCNVEITGSADTLLHEFSALFEGVKDQSSKGLLILFIEALRQSEVLETAERTVVDLLKEMLNDQDDISNKG